MSDPRTWIFQGNPDTFDIDGYLARDLDRISWTVSQHCEEIRPGHRVFLWRAAGRKTKAVSGIIASCTVLSAPWQGRDEPESHDLWREAHSSRDDTWHVWLRVERVANSKQVVKRAWLKDDPICRDLLILKQAAGTNYAVPAHCAERLQRLWDRTGVDWTRDDSVAGLWAYHATYGKQVSKKPESPVARVALRIGRAVGGVYNKVMNFRALDPRDERAGLPAGGTMDAEVWLEFFDDEKGQVRSARLRAAYEAAWGSDKAPRTARCIVWNNLHLPNIESAVEVSADLGRVALQRGGGALKSAQELVEESDGTVDLFLVDGTSNRVAARGVAEHLVHLQAVTEAERVSTIHDATKCRLATDDVIDQRNILFASAVRQCDPPLELTSFRKTSDGKPLQPGGRWRASVCWLPPTLTPAVDPDEPPDEQLSELPEGEERTRVVRHRRRERRLRDAKIRETLAEHGTLCCEVEGCGFDFEAIYGEPGRGYAQVHHLKPLATLVPGSLTRVEDLAVVCANCHALIHRGKELLSLEDVAAALRCARERDLP